VNNYLIPANSKKSALILGLFNPEDLIILGIGIGVSTVLLLSLNLGSFVTTAIALAPGLVCMFLVVPIPNYHNVLQLLRNIYKFFTKKRIYKWRGWWIYGGE